MGLSDFDEATLSFRAAAGIAIANGRLNLTFGPAQSSLVSDLSMPPSSSLQSLRALHGIRLFGISLALVGVFSFGERLVRAEEPACRCQDCPVTKSLATTASRTAGPWTLQSTKNFCVCCPAGTDGAAIGQACESLRETLTRKWLGEGATSQTWASKCYVVIHPSIESYLREVGAGGRNTLGSSLIKTDKRQVVSRRIDIRGNAADPLRAALPHELTHVVLADAFAGEELPRWADEGMAMLADPAEKLAGHSRDLNAAIAEHREFRLGELLVKSDYPTGAQRDVFYGESASLVAFLASQRPPARLVDFFHRASRDGYNAALQQVYGISDPGQLERLWRSQAHMAAAQSSDGKGENALNRGT